MIPNPTRSNVSRCRPRPTNQSGLSLIEVMVAVVVLSLGLLGMAALMGVSMRNTQEANYASQATNLAYELIESARGNFINRRFYHSPNWSDPAVCPAVEAMFDASACGDIHTCDLTRWQRELCHSLPNGRGRVNIANISAVAGEPRYTIAVDICWTGDRSNAVVLSGDCGDGNNDGFLDNPTASSESLLRVTSEL